LANTSKSYDDVEDHFLSGHKVVWDSIMLLNNNVKKNPTCHSEVGKGVLTI